MSRSCAGQRTRSCGPQMRTEGHKGCVLVVEDEAIIALDVEQILKAAAFDVVTCGSVQAALQAIDNHSFDCAVVDLNLHGSVSLAVVDTLERRGVRVVVTTACDPKILPVSRRLPHFIKKPFTQAELLAAVVKAMQTRDRHGSVAPLSGGRSSHEHF